MKFGGWQKCSLIDFPGKLSAVLFTLGCTFRCPFCHNPDLVVSNGASCLEEKDILTFLEQRKGKLDGVVISGGEPTIHASLPEFIRAIKNLGFAIKLDTNGSRPDVVEYLLSQNLVDYWAMDRKSSLARYSLLAGVPIDSAKIAKTSELVRKATDAYEFRTTVIREYHSEEEMETIAKELSGARRLILQQFRPEVTLDPSLRQATAYTASEMDHLCSLVKPHVEECFWR